jgi:para-aminobenzoate synthetase/4-amino-4-deoxychorismate lyase
LDKSASGMRHGQDIDRALFFSLLRKPYSLFLESSRTDDLNTHHYLFHDPIEVLHVHSLHDIPPLFQAVESHLAKNNWVAGYMGYECGAHFERYTADPVKGSLLPLAIFCVYESATAVDGGILNSEDRTDEIAVTEPRLSITEERYRSSVERIKEFIAAGDTYQVNYTDRIEFKYGRDEVDLYCMLRERQKVPFSAFFNLGGTQILSYSPELFFRRRHDRIITKPMKGTCKRGRTLDEDRHLSAWLQQDEKNRSENLMIVDLLRNDLGRICTPGSITVSEMYEVEKLSTVLQMTSTVSGKLNDTAGYYEIFRALFPCGSVTGAPKIRTMQIIHELEEHPRDVYCGAIGFFSPLNESVFSVAIRTPIVKEGIGVMGVGSGIVFDSDPRKEYDETLLKARFLTRPSTRFELLETILWDNGYTFLDEHLRRMRESSEFFSLVFTKENILDALHSAESSFRSGTRYRIRLLSDAQGATHIEYTILDEDPERAVIKIAPEQVDSSDPLYFHKTTHRPLYDRYSRKAREENIADYIFLNERSEITEGSISNIFTEKEGMLFTPPIHSGILNGIFRRHILTTNKNAIEKIITEHDLRHADSVYICNSVRGMRNVTLSE